MTATTTAPPASTRRRRRPSAGPAVFTEIIWFKTTSGYTGGGKLIGFETPRTGVGVAGSGGNYDRHIYLDGAGKVWFGVYNGADQTHRDARRRTTTAPGTWPRRRISPAGHARCTSTGSCAARTATPPPSPAPAGGGSAAATCPAGAPDWTGANNPGTNSAVTVNVPFLGSLDEATVYSGTALSASDIAYLYWTR